MKKTIITVVGNDTVGIIAKVCTYLAENQVNILDISQTIVQGYFNMMMIADTAKCEKDGGTLAKDSNINDEFFDETNNTIKETFGETIKLPLPA